MLHRSFKPAKCKTALKLAVSRIKLMKNKKEAVYKQQKREVSQLLESGQDRSARIRVEHVVREEKTMAAYELIEIYCELIVARLPIIESQKNCPIDLKEAITSVIFASPRCSDIPELMDIRKHFTAKYGKEFVSSAVELRPDCGVNRMLVEKLSAKAPDVQTKIKVLSAIAEEYNIKWDPNSLGEIDGKPTDDLLNGPKTFQNASKMYVEPPDVQAPQHRDQKHDVPVNPYEHNRNSSLSSQNFASTDVGTSKTTSSSARPEPRPSRTGAEGMESKHSFSGCANDSSLGRQNWNMEFKDATSAAQAAAESAERASMAARAAAELSSRGKITRQYSEEPQKSYVNGLGDEGQQTHAGSKLQSDNSVNNSFHATDSIHNGQIDGHEKDNQAGGDERFYSHSRKSSRSASLKSNTASPDDDTLVNSPQKADGYSQMSSSGVGIVKLNSGDFFAGAMKEQSSQSEGSEKQDGIKTDNFDSFGEERLRKQSSSASSHSHSSTLGDDHEFVSNTNQEKFENDIGQDLFVSVDQENIQTDTKQAHSYDHAALVFDDSGSDDDEGTFSVEDNYSRQESTFFTSPGRKSPICFSENTNTSISIENKSKSAGKSISQSHLFTELPEVSVGVTNSEVPSEPDDLLHVTFDHSDDSSSESEEELVKSKLGGMEYNAESQKRSGLGTSTNQRSPRLGKSQIGSGDMDKKSFYNEYDEEKSRQSFKHSAIHEIKNNVQTVESPHAMKDDEFLNQSSLDDSKEFNFGVLAGGLRNKGYRHPPYTRGPSSDSSSSSNPAVEETSATILEFPNSQSQKVGTKGDKELNTRAAVSSSDSDTDDFNQEPTSQKAGESLSSETSSKIQGMYFDSDTGDLKEDFPKQNLASKGRLGSGFSRRTRGSPSLSEKSSYPKVKVSAEMSVSSDHGAESRPSKISHATEKPRSSEQATSKPTPELNNSLHEERLKTSAIEKPSSPFSAEGSVSYGHGTERRPSKISYATEKPSSTEQATSKSMPELRNSLHEERLKTPAMEKPSSSFSGNTESSKFSSSSEKIPSTENSIKKASHVHPKLPDYDSITAHLQSLRSNKK